MLYKSFSVCTIYLCMLVDMPSKQAMQNGPDVRVMSFNIRCGSARDAENSWENRWELVFDVLREGQSDVVGLQEAERFQLDDIRKALPSTGK
ncbi:MAG: hypothetical protein O7D34_08390 [Ignavibacteria bacterium]|nr:hypothetical protein [Ignavibacteria bacterium]